MFGKVTASSLNVRNRPDKDGNKLGFLSQDAIVNILGESDNWFEIDFQGASGFASADYIRPLRGVGSLKARIVVALSNVRDAPNLTGRIIGTLTQDSVVNLVGEHPGWLEIEFNHATGFVGRGNVELIDGGTPQQGMVTAELLNVRAEPDADSEILGKLASGSVVTMLSRSGDWYEIRFNGTAAYIHADHVTTTAPAAERVQQTPTESAGEGADRFLVVPLPPAEKYNVAGSAEKQKVAIVWNKFGGLLQALADHHHIDIACAVAVLCVESSGKGFEQDNQNRMIVRFENHIFWQYWGKRQPEKFGLHFRYDSSKVWMGHQWRLAETGPWEDFHGSQVNEWLVLDFARRLDDAAALQSISMGAPQIMGFHYARIGFAGVQTMFDKFSADIRYQLLGLFDFFNASQNMIPMLQQLDFVKFAGQYNGSGQQDRYGAWIKAHYDAFKSLG